MRCVPGVHQELRDITVRGGYRCSVHVASCASEPLKLVAMMWDLLWLVLVPVVLERMRKPQTQYGFPASCVRMSVIFSLDFDLLHSNASLFLKET